MALSGLMGGIDPIAAFGSFLVAIGCACPGLLLALTISVWGRKTQDVLIFTYLIMTFWLFSRYLLGLAWARVVCLRSGFSYRRVGLARLHQPFPHRVGPVLEPLDSPACPGIWGS